MRIKSLALIFLLLCGWQARTQSKDSLTANRSSQTVKIFVAPATLIGLGLLAKNTGSLRFEVRDWRNQYYPNFSHHADDVMQFVPIGVVYALDVFRVKTKNDLLNQTLLLAKSELMTTLIVRVLKVTTDVTRPNGGSHAFPSGHTAQAFVAATFMHKELYDRSIWYSIGAYSMATTVGVFRILNNRHWISDVLAGAGFGIVSANVMYATHKYRWGKKPDMVLMPTYNNGPGVYFSFKLD